MKAISLKQPWASMIAREEKTIETRTWPTKYRGDLLIVASKYPKFPGLPHGKAVCIVELVDCRPMTKADEQAARCEIFPRAFAWLLDNIRPIEPFDVRGQLGFYEVDVAAKKKKKAADKKAGKTHRIGRKASQRLVSGRRGFGGNTYA